MPRKIESNCNKKDKEKMIASLRRLFGLLRNPRPYRERITADKREIRDFPKLPSATSFILDTLSEIAFKVSVYSCSRRGWFSGPHPCRPVEVLSCRPRLGGGVRTRAPGAAYCWGVVGSNGLCCGQRADPWTGGRAVALEYRKPGALLRDPCSVQYHNRLKVKMIKEARR